MATQWYCPLDVGAIDTSSGSVANTEKVSIHTTMKPYRMAPGPPLLQSVSRSAFVGCHALLKAQ
jgi:hypothetical protein